MISYYSSGFQICLEMLRDSLEDGGTVRDFQRFFWDSQKDCSRFSDSTVKSLRVSDTETKFWNMGGCIDSWDSWNAFGALEDRWIATWCYPFYGRRGDLVLLRWLLHLLHLLLSQLCLLRFLLLRLLLLLDRLRRTAECDYPRRTRDFRNFQPFPLLMIGSDWSAHPNTNSIFAW